MAIIIFITWTLTLIIACCYVIICYKMGFIMHLTSLPVCLQHKLTTAHWSVAGQLQLIASGDDKGYVVIWNIFTNDSSLHQPLSTDAHVFCLAFSPKTEHILAVG